MAYIGKLYYDIIIPIGVFVRHRKIDSFIENKTKKKKNLARDYIIKRVHITYLMSCTLIYIICVYKFITRFCCNPRGVRAVF